MEDMQEVTKLVPQEPMQGCTVEERGLSNPTDKFAKEVTHDPEVNFNQVAPSGGENSAKGLRNPAAKTQDILRNAVENAEVTKVQRAIFRAFTHLREEIDTMVRLETRAIDLYNGAHHFRREQIHEHIPVSQVKGDTTGVVNLVPREQAQNCTVEQMVASLVSRTQEVIAEALKAIL